MLISWGCLWHPWTSSFIHGLGSPDFLNNIKQLIPGCSFFRLQVGLLLAGGWGRPPAPRKSFPNLSKNCALFSCIWSNNKYMYVYIAIEILQIPDVATFICQLPPCHRSQATRRRLALQEVKVIVWYFMHQRCGVRQCQPYPYHPCMI